MFTVYIGSLMTSLLFIHALLGQGETDAIFILMITLVLWLTLLFAILPKPWPKAGGKAQAEALKKTRYQLKAKKSLNLTPRLQSPLVHATNLKKGDWVLVMAHEVIPADGDVIAGIAYVDQSAITGESAPVIREHGGDLCSVTAGTKVVSDWPNYSY